MVQLVTACGPRRKRSRSSTITPEQALLEEGPAPAAAPYASPEQRRPPAIGHEQPVTTSQ